MGSFAACDTTWAGACFLSSPLLGGRLLGLLFGGTFGLFLCPRDLWDSGLVKSTKVLNETCEGLGWLVPLPTWPSTDPIRGPFENVSVIAPDTRCRCRVASGSAPTPHSAAAQRIWTCVDLPFLRCRDSLLPAYNFHGRKCRSSETLYSEASASLVRIYSGSLAVESRPIWEVTVTSGTRMRVALVQDPLL